MESNMDSEKIEKLKRLQGRLEALQATQRDLSQQAEEQDAQIKLALGIPLEEEDNYVTSRSRPPKATKTVKEAGLEKTDYCQLLGGLKWNRHAAALHPFLPLAATGGAEGSLTLWSLSDSEEARSQSSAIVQGDPINVEHEGASGWRLLQNLNDSRSCHTRLVFKVLFLSPRTPPPQTSREQGSQDLNFWSSTLYLASCSADHTVKIWCWSRGQEANLGSRSRGVEPETETLEHSTVGSVQEPEWGNASSNVTAHQAENQGQGTEGNRDIEDGVWRLEQTLVDEESKGLATNRKSHSDDVTSLAYRPNPKCSTLLASGSDDGYVKIWSREYAGKDLNDEPHGRWKRRHALKHDSRVVAVEFSPCNGRLMVTSDAEGNLNIWINSDPQEVSGKWVRTTQFKQEGLPVRCIALGRIPVLPEHRRAMEDLVPDSWIDVPENDTGDVRELQALEETAESMKHAARLLKGAHSRIAVLVAQSKRREALRGELITEKGELLDWLRYSNGVEPKVTRFLEKNGVNTYEKFLGLPECTSTWLKESNRIDQSEINNVLEAVGKLKNLLTKYETVGSAFAERVAQAIATVGGKEELKLKRNAKEANNRDLVWDGAAWFEKRTMMTHWKTFWTYRFVHLQARVEQQAESIEGSQHLQDYLRQLPQRVVRSVEQKSTINKLSEPYTRFHDACDESLGAEHRLYIILDKAARRLEYTQARQSAYANQIAAEGCVVMAVSCDDLPLNEDARVHVISSVDKQRYSARLLAPILKGKGRKQTCWGFRAKLSGEENLDGQDLGGGEQDFPLDSIISSSGVQLYRLLPLLEARALDHAGEEAKRDSSKLRYKKGDRMIIRGDGHTVGWILAEFTASSDADGTGYVRGTLGDVKEKDLEVEEHSSFGSNSWQVTHCVDLSDDTSCLEFVGSNLDMLAICCGRRVSILMREKCGLIGSVDYSRGPNVRLAQLQEVSCNTDDFLNQWHYIDDIKHAKLGTCAALSCNEQMDGEFRLVVGGGEMSHVQVWDITKWFTATTARKLLQMWLQTSVSKRIADKIHKFIEESHDRALAAPLFLDASLRSAQRRNLTEQIEQAQKDPESSQGLEAQSLDELEHRLTLINVNLNKHREAKKDCMTKLMPYLENSEGTKLDRKTVSKLLTQALRRKILLKEQAETKLDGKDSTQQHLANVARELAMLERSNEFKVSTGGKSRAQVRRELKHVFDLLDSDQSGEIDEKEIQEHMKQLRLGVALRSEISRMIQMADEDKPMYFYQRRHVVVELEDVVRKVGDQVKKIGRRPKELKWAEPDDGEGELIWSIDHEKENQDPQHPDYMQTLKTIMGSVNPSDWKKVQGEGTIDFEEFVRMIHPEEIVVTASDTVKSALELRDQLAAEEARIEAGEHDPLLDALQSAFVTQDGREVVGDPTQKETFRAMAYRQYADRIFDRMGYEKIYAGVATDNLSELDLSYLQYPEFAMGRWKRRDPFLWDLFEKLSSNQSVRRLTLDAGGLGGVGISLLVDALKVNDYLVYLSAAENELMPKVGEELGIALRMNTCLETVILRKNKLGSGAKHIAEALSVNHSLTCLDISDNKLDDSDAFSFSKSLKGNETLKELHLNSNTFTDAAAVSFADVLEKDNMSLLALKLEMNSISRPWLKRIQTITSAAGVKMRRLLLGHKSKNALSSYLHAIMVTAEKNGARESHFRCLIAGNEKSLGVYPSRIPTEEFESILRFVPDPEDAALLLRWFKIPKTKPAPKLGEHAGSRPASRPGSSLATRSQEGTNAPTLSKSSLDTSREPSRSDSPLASSRHHAKAGSQLQASASLDKSRDYELHDSDARSTRSKTPHRDSKDPETRSASPSKSIASVTTSRKEFDAKSTARSKHSGRRTDTQSTRTERKRGDSQTSKSKSRIVEGSEFDSQIDVEEQGSLHGFGRVTSAEVVFRTPKKEAPNTPKVEKGILTAKESEDASAQAAEAMQNMQKDDGWGRVVKLGPRFEGGKLKGRTHRIGNWIFVQEDLASVPLDSFRQHAVTFSDFEQGLTSPGRVDSSPRTPRKSPTANSFSRSPSSAKSTGRMFLSPSTLFGAKKAKQDKVLAKVGLDGSAAAGGIGWLEVKLIKCWGLPDKMEKNGLVAQVSAQHTSDLLCQGPFQTSVYGPKTLKDEWHEKFRFGWHTEAHPDRVSLDVMSADKPNPEDALATVQIFVSLHAHAVEPYFQFGGRAVRIDHNNISRDEERWFILRLTKATSSSTKHAILRDDMSIDSGNPVIKMQLTFRMHEAPAGQIPWSPAGYSIESQDIVFTPDRKSSSSAFPGLEMIRESSQEFRSKDKDDDWKSMVSARTSDTFGNRLKLRPHSEFPPMDESVAETESVDSIFEAEEAIRISRNRSLHFEWVQDLIAGRRCYVVKRLASALESGAELRGKKAQEQLHSQSSKFQGPTLAYSSGKSLRQGRARPGPIGKENWHQHYWGLSDPKVEQAWHPPLAW